ncbi:right-handed parallel beta-helix repeat-containing protein [bacterium]|nr:right-handed parallel beta-helix repeat-containing protein [bacterium]
MKNQFIRNLLFVLLSLTNITASAKEWVINSITNSADSSDLQKILDSIPNGDSVLLKDGHYKIGRYSLKKDIEIRGESKSGVTIEMIENVSFQSVEHKLKLSQLSFTVNPSVTLGQLLTINKGDFEASDLNFDCKGKNISGLELDRIKSATIKNISIQNCFKGLSVFETNSAPVVVEDLKIENSKNYALHVTASSQVKVQNLVVNKSAGINFYKSSGRIDQVNIRDCSDFSMGIAISENSNVDVNAVDMTNCGGVGVLSYSKGQIKDVKINNSSSDGVQISSSEVVVNNLNINGALTGISISKDSKFSFKNLQINKIKNLGIGVNSNSTGSFSEVTITDVKSGFLHEASKIKLSNVQITNVETGYSCNRSCGSLEANDVKIVNFQKEAWFWPQPKEMSYSGSGNSPDPILFQRQRFPKSGY